MDWFILTYIFSTILSLVQVDCLSDNDKNMEVIILHVVLKYFQKKYQFRLNLPLQGLQVII